MSTTEQLTVLLAAALTAGAASVLPVAATAHAEGCNFYNFPAAPPGSPSYKGFNFNVELVQNNGLHIYLQTTPNAVNQAMYVNPNAPELVGETIFTGGDPNPAAISVRGAADGGLQGRTIEFKVRWENQFTNVYKGKVNDDGTASGTTVNNGGATNTWRSAFADFKCAPERSLGKLPEVKPPIGTVGNPSTGQSNPTATVVSDVDVYNAKNEPDGAGKVAGVLRTGKTVTLVGNCAPESWCEVTGDAVPNKHGWVWGHLKLP